MTEHILFIGDATSMTRVRDESVELVLTSPPYYAVKDYGHPDQLGYFDDYEMYIDKMNQVWSGCLRALKPGGRIVINIGDMYTRTSLHGRHRIIPIRERIIRFMEKCDVDYMGAIIWQKIGTSKPSGGASVMGSFPYPRNGLITMDYEFILIFKKPGVLPASSREVKESGIMTKDEWRRFFSGHWNFLGARQTSHIAAFPYELPYRIIRMFTLPGDWVLDPFMGSGTTMVAARNLGRSSIGYELNPRYASVAEHRMGELSIFIENFKFMRRTVDGKATDR